MATTDGSPGIGKSYFQELAHGHTDHDLVHANGFFGSAKPTLIGFKNGKCHPLASNSLAWLVVKNLLTVAISESNLDAFISFLKDRFFSTKSGHYEDCNCVTKDTYLLMFGFDSNMDPTTNIHEIVIVFGVRMNERIRSLKQWLELGRDGDDLLLKISLIQPMWNAEWVMTSRDWNEFEALPSIKLGEGGPTAALYWTYLSMRRIITDPKTENLLSKLTASVSVVLSQSVSKWCGIVNTVEAPDGAYDFYNWVLDRFANTQDMRWLSILLIEPEDMFLVFKDGTCLASLLRESTIDTKKLMLMADNKDLHKIYATLETIEILVKKCSVVVTSDKKEDFLLKWTDARGNYHMDPLSPATMNLMCQRIFIDSIQGILYSLPGNAHTGGLSTGATTALSETNPFEHIAFFAPLGSDEKNDAYLRNNYEGFTSGHLWMKGVDMSKKKWMGKRDCAMTTRAWSVGDRTKKYYLYLWEKRDYHEKLPGVWSLTFGNKYVVCKKKGSDFILDTICLPYEDLDMPGGKYDEKLKVPDVEDRQMVVVSLSALSQSGKKFGGPKLSDLDAIEHVEYVGTSVSTIHF